ncbi:MAG: acyl-CoA dehydrogenase family protein [Myxococcota bacterium]
MQFEFSEDQALLQQTVRDFLEGECTPEWIREIWQSESGHSPEFWSKLAEVGVPGLRISEAHDGLGLDEIDFVLLHEEVGRAALPAPVIATAAVAAPLLAESGRTDLAERWLPAIAGGEATVAVAHPASPLVADAAVARLLLVLGDEVHAVPAEDVRATAQPANDPGRRLFSVDWTPSDETLVAAGAEARALTARAFDRGALACAAQQLGVCDRLITLAVDYATQRQQFGVPIGSFQAVKHMLANVKVELEYARSLVYRAAHTVAREGAPRAADVSAAKLAASDAALGGAKTALQVHGAIGYTWEQDLHIWMRRAWSLDLAWGDNAFHRARLADAVIDGVHPAEPFGYAAPETAH